MAHVFRRHKLVGNTSRRLLVTQQQHQKAASFAAFDVSDPLNVAQRLTEEERLVQESARSFSESYLRPRITQQYRDESWDAELLPAMGAVGLLGSTLDGYGCAGVSSVSYGLTCHEVEKVDSAYRSALSVQSSLVMGPIAEFGSAELKRRLLPALAKGERVGCFALTEPDAGSDPAAMRTTCTRLDEEVWELSGSKTWISHSPLADVLIVWCRDMADAGKIKGFVLDKQEGEMAGLSCPKIEGKLSLRASLTGMVLLDRVRVADSARLAVEGLRGPFSCLNNARYGIAWGALGAAADCLSKATAYAKDRKMFAHPLASYQLVQYKLAHWLSEVALGLEACLQVGRLKDEAMVHPAHISLIKRNSCMKALHDAILRKCRELLDTRLLSDYTFIIRKKHTKHNGVYAGGD